MKIDGKKFYIRGKYKAKSYLNDITILFSKT